MAREGKIASVITQAIQSSTEQIFSARIILKMIEWMKWGKKLLMKKFDPKARKHVEYKEQKLK